MILLLEGVNRTGKSTLAKQFAGDLGWPILKFNIPPDCAFAYFVQRLGCSADDDGNLIVDRCHLSNWAYKGLLGGGVMNLEQWLSLDEYLTSLKTWLFLLVDDPFAIEQRLQRRKDRGDGANDLHRHTLGHLQQEFVVALGMSRIEVKGTFTLPQFIDPSTGQPTDHYYSIYEQILRETGARN